MNGTKEKGKLNLVRPLSSGWVNQLEDIQTVNKNPSQELLNMIEEWSNSYINTRDLPSRILQQAAEEHISNDIVRELIIKSLNNRGLGDRQIRRLMPEALRDSRKTNITIRHSNADTMSASPEPEPVGHIEPTQPTYESPALERSFIVKTKLIVKTDKGDYAAEVTAVCYPDSQIIELEPIQRASILRVTESL